MLCQKTWPPQSPTLNLIDMVWDEMDHRVKAKQPTSAQHLLELIHDFWKTISGDYLMKLIKRMARVSEKLSSKQKVATLKNIKYKTYSYLFNTFLTKQNSSVVKTSFFQVRLLAKIKPYLPHNEARS